MEVFNNILAQEKYSKNKIYNMHEPQVKCILKGKSLVKYEYSNKNTFLMTVIECIILGAANNNNNNNNNRYDNISIPELLELLSSLYDGYKPSNLIIDINYSGYQKYTDLNIIIPHKDDKKLAPAD
jgi:IS5 family transposase